MEDKSTEKKQVLGNGILHPGARPMQFIIDKDGCIWVCDKPVDPNKPLKDQACWKCKDMAFTRND
jgi:streptogramin lyase